MDTMIEFYYEKPEDQAREKRLSALAEKYGGRLTFKESGMPNTICLTIEFENWEQAVEVADMLRSGGDHIEGPCSY